MKIYKRMYQDDGTYTEEIQTTLEEAMKTRGAKDKVHVCRHEEGLPCELR